MHVSGSDRAKPILAHQATLLVKAYISYRDKFNTGVLEDAQWKIFLLKAIDNFIASDRKLVDIKAKGYCDDVVVS